MSLKSHSPFHEELAMFYCKIFLQTFSLFALAFCNLRCDSSSSSGNNAALSLHSTSIELAEISNEKCFNLEKYLNLLNSAIGDPSARKMTTGFEVTAFKKNHITRNFEIRLALGNFIFEDAKMSQFPELKSVSQIDCKTATQTFESGTVEYKITHSEKDSISLTDSWDNEFTYQWLSPTHLKIILSFTGSDALCEDSSLGRIKVTKEFFWGPELNSKDTIPANLITDTYLNLLSESTGYSKNNLFVNADSSSDTSPQTDKISIRRLKELSEQPIKPEFLVCN